jgi:tetratricopeptide (TPR) repeat protein
LLARRGGHQYPSDSLTTEPVRVPGADSALRFSREDDTARPAILWRGIVAVSGNRAFLAIAWQNALLEGARDRLDKALETFSIPPAPAALPVPSDETQRAYQADTLHVLGVRMSNKADWLNATELFRSAFRISTHNDVTLESLATSLAEVGDRNGAKEVLDAHQDRMARRRSLRTFRAQMRDSLGDTDGAIADYATAFAEGHRGEDDLFLYFNLLIRAQKAPGAVKAIEDYMSRGATPRVRRWLALACHAAGDSKRAMEILGELAASTSDPLNDYSLGEIANDAGDYARAAAAAASLIKAGQDTARSRMIEGWSLFGRKQWREAKESFEKARKFQPENTDVAAALVRVSAMLGEGDNSSVKAPLPANAIPPAVLAEIEKAAKDFKPPEGASAWYLMRATVFRYRKGEPFSKTLHRRVHLAGQAAVADFSTLTFPFDPVGEEIFVNNLEVIDEKGGTIARGVPEEQYLLDQSTFAVEATHGKLLRVVVPGLKAGRTLQFTVTMRDRAKSDTFPFQRYFAATAHPAASEAFLLLGDVPGVRVETSAQFDRLALRKEGADFAGWIVRQPPPWQPEPRLPLTDEFLPMIWLGDREAQWLAEGRDYLREIQSLLEPDASTAALARDLTKDAKSAEEKVRLLTQHIQKNVTYQAVEFGRRARIPKPPARSLASHYGDCKDQALLLHHLLTGAGIRSHLALISTDSAVRAGLPSLDQFNHMIVHVPELKARFVDSTAGQLPGGLLPPELFRRQALVLDPANPHLEQMPAREKFPAERMEVESDISVSEDGGSDVRETIRFSGYQAAWMRGWFAGIEPAKHVQSLQGLVTASRWRLQEVTVDAADKIESDLVLKLRYSIPAAAGSVSVPAIWEEQFLVGPFLKERRNPFELAHPLRVQSHAVIHTRRQLTDDALKSFAARNKNTFGQWETRATRGKESDAFSLSFEFDGATGIFPAERYSEWQASWSSAVEAWRRRIGPQ